MLADKPTELSRIKLKSWTRQPVPKISEHSAHLTPMSVDVRTWLWRYTYLLLWHRQAIFKSKGVNFDALAQASDIQIETRQVVFLCRMQDLNLGSQKPNRQQNRKETSCVPLQNAGFEPRVPDTKSPADWMLADKPTELSRIKLKTWCSTTRPYDQWVFSPQEPTVGWLSHLTLPIYIFVVVNFDALAQASDIQIKRRQVVFLCRMQALNPVSKTPNRQQTECSLTNRLSDSEDQAKNLNRLSYRGSS